MMQTCKLSHTTSRGFGSVCQRPAAARPTTAPLRQRSVTVRANGKDLKPVEAVEAEQQQLASTALLAAAGLLLPLMLDADTAMAAPALLKGRTASLIHPAVMLFLFGGSVYSGYLGFQWRRARELAGVIKEKKAALPKPDAEGNRPSSALDGEIAALEAERKGLISQKLNEKHNNWGSLLLGLGVTISISGAFNTYLRTGKLFPGPHLFAGAAITICWALAAALVPAMQKGNDNARSAHIALNTINILLFAWQIPTGWEIVTKVLEFTSWP